MIILVTLITASQAAVKTKSVTKVKQNEAQKMKLLRQKLEMKNLLLVKKQIDAIRHRRKLIRSKKVQKTL
jgi:hypothetical protein